MSEPSSPLLIAVRDVRKTYHLGGRSIEVLRGVQLDVQSGEFVALRGASGAGKSTLLHLLGGLDLPDSGEILFEGRSLRSYGSLGLPRWRNANVGLIFQSYHLLPELNAVENVFLPAAMGRAPRAKTITRARDLLTRVGLAQRLDHRPAELSGGEQQRVAIARALINEPRLLLADEPTGNLDQRTGDEIISLLCSLRDEFGTTLVIATHDNHVATRAPRSIELADGIIG
jgi:predicted ABC-type transport system involved in lysophospholipase L1 biosynthesis ATPase subunit